MHRFKTWNRHLLNTYETNEYVFKHAPVNWDLWIISMICLIFVHFVIEAMKFQQMSSMVQFSRSYLTVTTAELFKMVFSLRRPSLADSIQNVQHWTNEIYENIWKWKWNVKNHHEKDINESPQKSPQKSSRNLRSPFEKRWGFDALRLAARWYAALALALLVLWREFLIQRFWNEASTFFFLHVFIFIYLRSMLITSCFIFVSFISHFNESNRFPASPLPLSSAPAARSVCWGPDSTRRGSGDFAMHAAPSPASKRRVLPNLPSFGCRLGRLSFSRCRTC